MPIGIARAGDQYENSRDRHDNYLDFIDDIYDDVYDDINGFDSGRMHELTKRTSSFYRPTF